MDPLHWENIAKIVPIIKSCHDKKDETSLVFDFTEGESDPTDIPQHPSFSMPTFDPQEIMSPDLYENIPDISTTEENDENKTVYTNPSDLVGRTFLMKPRDDGQRFQAHIVDCIESHEDTFTKQPEHIKFRCSINDDQYDELLTYQEIID